jgi:hypothetical protein
MPAFVVHGGKCRDEADTGDFQCGLQWVRAKAPHLRIIDDDLWSDAKARQAQYGRASKHKTSGRSGR